MLIFFVNHPDALMYKNRDMPSHFLEESEYDPYKLTGVETDSMAHYLHLYKVLHQNEYPND